MLITPHNIPGPRDDSPPPIRRRDFLWTSASGEADMAITQILREASKGGKLLLGREISVLCAMSIVHGMNKIGLAETPEARERLTAVVSIFTKLTPTAVTLERFAQELRAPLNCVKREDASHLLTVIGRDWRARYAPESMVQTVQNLPLPAPGLNPDQVSLGKVLRDLVTALTTPPADMQKVKAKAPVLRRRTSSS